MRNELVISLAKEIVKAAAERGMTAMELKYACGWASSAPNDRVEEVQVLASDADAIEED